MDDMVFAIGDVHGASRLLSRMVGWIEETAAEHCARPVVYLLGDLVDRGPDSRGALEIAAEILMRWSGSRMLLGNHDRWFLDVLDGVTTQPDVAGLWLNQGGEETLRSYGLSGGRLRDTASEIALRHPGHLRILRQASLHERRDGVLFVHAGIEPGRSLADQGEREFLWIRRPFLDHVGPLGFIVVHGHTPQKGSLATVTENRISLDTGACITGVLTAAAWPPPFGSAAPIFAATSPDDRHVRRVEPRRLDRGFGTVLDRAG